jgi:hypothetical protein
MADTPLQQLRELRDRAAKLLDHQVVATLTPFLHQKDNHTFRRKPDSESRQGDVNITTTCSCVMALALTNNFHSFYFPGGQDGSDDQKAQELLTSLVSKPWMSSGLTSNNPFTTALVLRTFGFLKRYKLLSSTPPKKQWHLELNLESQNLNDLLRRLKEQNDETTLFLYRCLSDATRAALNAFSPLANGSNPSPELIGTLTSDLRRIVHNGYIYTPGRFPRTTEPTRLELQGTPYSYRLAELNHMLLAEEFSGAINMPAERSFEDIANIMASNENYFRINNYPPAVPVMYWFVDGVDKGGIGLGKDEWVTLGDFANKEFNRQRSLVLAEHDAMMDPVAMGMAACLCARLSAIFKNKNKETEVGDGGLENLPSRVELLHSIKEVFKQQTESGIWPKYFPMFHYQEAGSNFCFTFELLEAILHEFAQTSDTDTGASNLFDDPEIVRRLDQAVTWCERNYVETRHKKVSYGGWNSGGDLNTLRKNQPESWATAVVFMFLWELKESLSSDIQRKLLRKYKANLPNRKMLESIRLDQFLDIEIATESNEFPLTKFLRQTLVNANSGKEEADVRRDGVKPPMSALFFGPPGTSKTNLAAALAEALKWPMIVINPSAFVKQGFENVYLQADEIFRDINDLSAVVAFFDEMDPLMQSREKDGLDTPTQFLTTSMLPQLAQLHDRRQVIFFVATNYISRFDPALTRAGRFDLLLCMGPPTFSEKIEKLPNLFTKKELTDAQRNKAKAKLTEYAPIGSEVYFQLELYTFHEFRRFLSKIGNGNDIGDKLETSNKSDFKKLVDAYSEQVILRINDLPSESRTFSKWSEIDLPENPVADEKDILKYLRDRKKSRIQYG